MEQEPTNTQTKFLRVILGCEFFFNLFWCENCQLQNINLIIFLKTKFSIRYDNFIIVPSSSRPNARVHIGRHHVNIFSHALTNLTRSVTMSVLISFDIFLTSTLLSVISSKLFRKAQWAANTLAVLPIILSLAELANLTLGTHKPLCFLNPKQSDNSKSLRLFNYTTSN